MGVYIHGWQTNRFRLVTTALKVPIEALETLLAAVLILSQTQWLRGNSNGRHLLLSPAVCPHVHLRRLAIWSSKDRMESVLLCLIRCPPTISLLNSLETLHNLGDRAET
jgi:hypothetical protein